MIERKHIAKRIQSRRLELNMTQNDLAEALHISSQAISKWERGLSFPDFAFLDELAEHLCLSFNELLG